MEMEENKKAETSLGGFDAMSSAEKAQKKKTLTLMLILAVVGVIIGLVISFITVVAVKQTSDVNFCSACHTMGPEARAYRNSVHGGYGPSGFVAKCADCHLPHDSTLGYLVQKVRTGMHDVWVETTHDNTANIDWEEKRENRREWTYDSSCLHCHENLLRGTRPNKKAFLAHKAYFSDKLVVEEHGERVPAMCVDCHKHVGHYNLSAELEKFAEEKDDYEAPATPAHH